MVMPVFVMMREHGQIWRTMDTLAALVAEEADPQQIADTGARLLDELCQHNSKEEPVIYPHADTDLPAATQVELTRLVKTGHLPDGWVCEHARV
jgi:hemerythrin superfamily protein